MTVDDLKREYVRARAAHIKALERVKRARAALVASKAKPLPRDYTLADIDAFFPPAVMLQPSCDEQP